jgi:hypothetical protein
MIDGLVGTDRRVVRLVISNGAPGGRALHLLVIEDVKSMTSTVTGRSTSKS